MEAVPRLPMLSFDLKTSLENPSFGPKLKQYIRDFYNEDPDMYSNEIHNLEGLRAQAVCAIRNVSGCQALKRYYCQLHFLHSRFPMAKDGSAAVSFTWQESYTNMPCCLADIRFEMVCILYNIGALHVQLGASDSRVSADGMKMCCTHFQCAAWAFQHLKDTYPQPAGVDLAPNVMLFMYHLSLAQAQECILEKSMMDNRKATIIAKVAVQVVDYYNLAMNILESGSDECSVGDTVGSKLYKNWKRYIKFKTVYHSAVSLLYHGQQAEEQQKMGERVAFYQAASDKLKEAMKLSKGMDDVEAVNEALAFTMDVIEGKKKAAKNENEFIYHEEVPERDALHEVKGASLVKGIPFSVTDSEISGADIFARLVPMKAHEASSLYSEEKAKLRRRIGLAIDEKDQELIGFMTSLQLEQLNVHSQPDVLPQELVDRCAAISAKPNAIQNLIEAMNKLADTYHDVEGMLQDIRELLQMEEVHEKEYQEMMGKRPPSIVATDLTREANKYQEAHAKASESNQTLHKAMTLHIGNLRVLAQPLDDLHKQIPTVSILNSPMDESSVKEMRHLVGKVEEMKHQRLVLADSLRAATSTDDITSQLVTRAGESLDAIFQHEMLKHQRIVATIEQNLAAQDNILKALTEAYARYAGTRKATVDIVRSRQTTINALIASYDAYEDLLAKSAKGLEFYRKLETNVTKLLQRVKGTCRVQDEQREQILAKNCKTVAAEKPAAAETAPRGGPKLKDYLDSMKMGGGRMPTGGGYANPSVATNPYYNASYGGGHVPPAVSPLPAAAYYDPTAAAPLPSDTLPWVPSVRPAPVGQEGSEQTASACYSSNATANTKFDAGKTAAQHGYPYATPSNRAYYSDPSAQYNYTPSSYPSSYTQPNQSYSQAYPAATSSAPYATQYAPQYQSSVASQGQGTVQDGQSYATGQGTAGTAQGGQSYATGQGTAAQYQYQQGYGTEAKDAAQTSHQAGYVPPALPHQQQSYPVQPSEHKQSYPTSAYLAQQQTGYPAAQTGNYPTQHSNYAAQSTQQQQQQQQQTYPVQPNQSQPSNNLAHSTQQQQQHQQPQQQQQQQQPTYPSQQGSGAVPPTPTAYYPQQSYPSSSSPQHQGTGGQYNATAAAQQTSTSQVQPQAQSYVGHPAYSYSSATGQYQYASGYPAAPFAADSQNASGVWPQQQYSAQNALYGRDYAAKPAGGIAAASSEIPQANQTQYYGNVRQQYGENPTASTVQSEYGTSVTPYQYNTNPADSQYTSAGNNQTSQTSSNQSAVSGQAFAAQYSGPTGYNTPGGYSQGNYYSVPYGHQNDGSTNVQPPSSQQQTSQQSTYMAARVPSAITTTTHSQPSPASLSSSTSADSSNVDLLAGLDFTINQAPLTPQQTAVKKKEEQQAVKNVGAVRKQNGVGAEAPKGVVAVNGRESAVSQAATAVGPPKMNDMPVKVDGISSNIKLEVLRVEAPDDGKLSLRGPGPGPGKDPYTDPDTLGQFVQEVEKYEKFVDGLTTRTLNGPTPLDMKWKELLDLQEKDANRHSISVARCYPMKNRFPDILPYDNSRVELPSTKDDYINASIMRNLTPLTPTFILTQAPLPSTYNDFWTMIWEQQVEVIACLLSDAELQAQVYWPVEKSQELAMGQLKLTLQSSDVRPHWVERIVSLCLVETRATRVVVHLQFTAWPGSSFPASPGPFLGFVSETLSYYYQQRGPSHPLPVHCLSGVGRSGLFCLVAAALCEIQAGRGLLELVTVAAQMSAARKGALRDREHLKFAYQAMLYYAQDMLMKHAANKPRNFYESQTIDGQESSSPSKHFAPADSLGGSVCSSGRSSPTHSLVDFSRFSLKPEQGASKSRKRYTKESFASHRRNSTTSLDSQSDLTGDPLSQLDPLWQLK